MKNKVYPNVPDEEKRITCSIAKKQAAAVTPAANYIAKDTTTLRAVYRAA